MKSQQPVEADTVLIPIGSLSLEDKKKVFIQREPSSYEGSFFTLIYL